MEDFFEKHGITKEARTAIVLNTFMYADRCSRIKDAPSFRSIVNQMYAKLDGYVDTQKAALEIVYEYLKNGSARKEVGELKFVNFSQHMDKKYTGAYAAAFKRVDEDNRITEVYVVFRGTGSGRWYDNGEGLFSEASKYQNAALRYFNDTIRSLELDEDTRIIVTGHSKGGNLSQFVTLKTEAEFRKRIKYCISFDGQGFSPEMYNSIKVQPFYQEQCDKMYSICGDNDYVNVLGIKVISREHTVYIVTKPPFTDMYGAHSIVPQLYSDVKEHMNDFLFDFTRNRFNEQTTRQRQLAECSMAMSEKTMEMSRERRAKTCSAIMTAAEKFIGGNNSYEGLLGEQADTNDCIGFLSDVYNVVIPLVSYAGKEAGDDIFFIVLIGPDVSDKSLLTAPENRKLEYVMSSQQTRSLYYLGLTLAYEIMLDGIAEYGYKLGELTAPEMEAKMNFFYHAFLKISDKKQTMERGFQTLVRYAAEGLADLIAENEDIIKQMPVSGLAKLVMTAINSLFGGKKETAAASASGHQASESAQTCCQPMSEECMAETAPAAEFFMPMGDMPCAATVAASPKKKYFIEGTEGDDGIIGGDDGEHIMGYGGDDGIHGYGGDDEIYGGSGCDRLYGEDGNDSLYGEDGDDMMYGKDGDDFMDGGSGDDIMKGGSGNDTIRGSLGDDIIAGESGNDILCGGLGSDRYIFGRGFGNDIISDNYSENVIEFRSISPDELKAELNAGGELVIGMKNAPDSIRIRNYSADRFNFVFDSNNYVLKNTGNKLAFTRKY
ncbi:MAG: DUF2974 domain-containing protein [Ruminococcus sp.]|uniref:Mbeg1-like protein n=1 Tax=Ruminococcus sp. TaxID=41978 RepID=UPI0025E431D1|nr:Mbeg1-like protein [Ruminococcus sp.]MBR5682132.1 DUF2974 domain-containing protein [Ruminococcus sp.]